MHVDAYHILVCRQSQQGVQMVPRLELVCRLYELGIKGTTHIFSGQAAMPLHGTQGRLFFGFVDRIGDECTRQYFWRCDLACCVIAKGERG